MMPHKLRELNASREALLHLMKPRKEGYHILMGLVLRRAGGCREGPHDSRMTRWP